MALIDKASLLMVPSTYEAGKLYNVLPSGNRAPDSTDQNSGYDQTRADFDFDRGSNAAATRVNASGLIEKYRENLLLQSNNFGTTWLNSGTTETSGQSGYDETNDAWLITKSVSDGYIYQNISQSGVQCVSVYAKANALGGIQIYVNAGTTRYQSFNLTNGTLIGSGNGIDAKIESVGNGWYRCSISFNDTITRVRFYPMTDAGDKTTTSGSIYIQSAQLESGLVASSYLDSTSVTGKAGVLVDLPRINYDANGENGSLLLEPSRKNRLQYSNYFGNWTISGNISITPNQVVSPEGLQNASVIDFSSATATPGVYVFGGTPSASVSRTIYLKGAVGGETLDFSDPNQGGGSNITLTTEWQRFEFTGGSAALCGIWLKNSVGNIIHAYGAQIEEGSYPTSLIPNHGESGGVTRAADSCSVTGVSDVIGQSEGTMFVEMGDDVNFGTVTTSIFCLDNNTANNRIELRYGAASNRLQLVARSSGSVQASISNSDYNILLSNKVAIKYKANDFALWINGVEVGTDTSGNAPSVLSELAFDDGNGTSDFYGKVREVQVFTEALTDEQLQKLTTI